MAVLKIDPTDAEYARTATHLRQHAMDHYGRVDFQSCTQGQQEIAISIWPSAADARRWKQDLEHQMAQQQGQMQWYERYDVIVSEIVVSEIIKHYSGPQPHLTSVTKSTNLSQV